LSQTSHGEMARRPLDALRPGSGVRIRAGCQRRALHNRRRPRRRSGRPYMCRIRWRRTSDHRRRRPRCGSDRGTRPCRSCCRNSSDSDRRHCGSRRLGRWSPRRHRRRVQAGREERGRRSGSAWFTFGEGHQQATSRRDVRLPAASSELLAPGVVRGRQRLRTNRASVIGAFHRASGDHGTSRFGADDAGPPHLRRIATIASTLGPSPSPSFAQTHRRAWCPHHQLALADPSVGHLGTVSRRIETARAMADAVQAQLTAWRS